jgi:hypothetical protein
MGIELGAKNLYKAYGVPSLDLTFADKKSLVDRISGNNLITFTRSSTATYVGADGLIQSAASGAARFDHDPTTGESLGLLVEEARTNSQTYSNSFSTNWTLNQNGTTTVTPNSAIGPSGQLDATKLSNTTGAYIQGPSFISGNNIGFGMSATFNLATKVTTINGNPIGSISASIQEAGNGWFRCIYMPNTSIKYAQTVYVKAAESSILTIEHWVDAIRLSVTGGISAGVYIWGAQVEAGAFPTSYIPTVASTVTRAADVASITGTNFSSWYNNTEGTFVTDAILAFTQNAGNPFTFGGVFYTVVNGSFGAIRTLGNGGVMSSGLSDSLTSFSKAAVALKSGDFAIGLNGSISNSSSTVYTPAGTQWAINSSLGSLGRIKRLTYYPVRLPDATLQALTQ